MDIQTDQTDRLQEFHMLYGTNKLFHMELVHNHQWSFRVLDILSVGVALWVCVRETSGAVGVLFLFCGKFLGKFLGIFWGKF